MVLQGISNRLLSAVEGGRGVYSMSDLLDYILNTEKREDPYSRFLELVNMPEQDSYTYWNNASSCNTTTPGTPQPDCVGRSMICEVFVWSVYKAAGVIPPSLTASIQAGEIDPRSSYLPSVYNTSFVWEGHPECAAQVSRYI